MNYTGGLTSIEWVEYKLIDKYFIIEFRSWFAYLVCP